MISVTSLRPGVTTAIAESIVGAVHWHGPQGYCRCPGEYLHTTRTSPTDCKVVCEPVAVDDGVLKPGVYCFHSSCEELCEAACYALRSALGRNCPSSMGFTPGIASTRREPVPTFDAEKLRRVAAKLDGADELWFAERSPVRVDTRTAASFLHALYRPSERVLVFDDWESQGQHLWQHKSSPFDASDLDGFRRGRLHGVWFLTNPVDGEFRQNDRGQQSRRSWQNVTSWRYLVLESDKADSAAWLAVLAQLPLPIAGIYASGGKSIHALVRIDAESKAHWNAIVGKMKPILTILGADPKAMSAVRLSRLPCCERGQTGRMQELLYLNPTPKCAPICELQPP